jgi:formylglycine-generating enzyme required for sulfatase activity
MADIFISYAREDLERVRPIVRLIEGAGWSVFWDRTIPAGMTWRQYIGKALDEAKCIVVVWSKSSVPSKFVQEEADDGSEREILIPVIIENVRPPLGFRSIQHEDLSEWKGEPNHRRAKGLIKSVEGIAGKPEKPPFAPPEKPESKPEDSTSIRIEELKSSPRKHKTGFFSWVKVAALSVATSILLIGIVIWMNKPKAFTNSLGMEFVLIPPGSFAMGSQIKPEEAAKKFGGDIGWYKNEHPAHPVKISKPFYLQKTEVTQGQWKSVMGQNPSFHSDCGDDCPVENVSWDEVQIFLEKLNNLEGLEGAGRYRLPTEAEWEYACRAGTSTEFSFGDDVGQLYNYAWFIENSDQINPVGTKKPNPWGIYDMHGNVWEWVEDNLHRNYNGAPDDGRAWVGHPQADRVVRGGGWNYDARNCRSAARHYFAPDFNGSNYGFRIARSVGPGS